MDAKIASPCLVIRSRAILNTTNSLHICFGKWPKFKSPVTGQMPVRSMDSAVRPDIGSKMPCACYSKHVHLRALLSVSPCVEVLYRDSAQMEVLLSRCAQANGGHFTGY